MAQKLTKKKGIQIGSLLSVSPSQNGGQDQFAHITTFHGHIYYRLIVYWYYTHFMVISPFYPRGSPQFVPQSCQGTMKDPPSHHGYDASAHGHRLGSFGVPPWQQNGHLHMPTSKLAWRDFLWNFEDCRMIKQLARCFLIFLSRPLN